jgi:LysM repeat protein
LDDRECWQYLPWDHRGWHAGGKANDTHIGFEICEPKNLMDKAYFETVYANAVELCAMLVKMYGIAVENIIDHAQAYRMGIGSNHADVGHWFPKHGKNMDIFRADVRKALAESSAPAPKPVSTTGDADVWKFLKGKGLSDFAVAGIMGNLFAESGIRSNNLQNSYERSLGMTDEEYTAAVDNGTYTNFVRDSAGYGLVQWTYWSRKDGLLKFVKAKKASIGDLATQLEYLWQELQAYTNAMKVLKTATSVRQASDVILLDYERPSDQSEAVKVTRATYGQKYYDKYAVKPVTPVPVPVPVPTPQPSVVTFVHTVRFGETLSSIGKKYGVAWQKIAEANKLANPNLIRVGQKLVIPGNKVAPAPYTVKRGDTLGAIAQKYGYTVAELSLFNGIKNPNLIQIGQVIKFPAK